MINKLTLCKLGWHDWSEWSKPKAGKKSFWGFEDTIQDRACNRCHQHDVRQL